MKWGDDKVLWLVASAAFQGYALFVTPRGAERLGCAWHWRWMKTSSRRMSGISREGGTVKPSVGKQMLSRLWQQSAHKETHDARCGLSRIPGSTLWNPASAACCFLTTPRHWCMLMRVADASWMPGGCPVANVKLQQRLEPGKNPLKRRNIYKLQTSNLWVTCGLQGWVLVQGAIRYLFQSKKFLTCSEFVDWFWSVGKKPWQLAVFLNCILVYLLPRPSHMCILIGSKLWSGWRSKRKQLSLGRRLNGKDFFFWKNRTSVCVSTLSLWPKVRQGGKWGDFPRSFQQENRIDQREMGWPLGWDPESHPGCLKTSPYYRWCGKNHSQ